MIPAIFSIAAEIARARGAAIRVSHEALGPPRRWLRRLAPRLLRGGIVKKLVLSGLAMLIGREADVPRADHYVGILDTGKMNRAALGEAVRRLPDGITEINLHPGLSGAIDTSLECSRADRQFVRSGDRAAELAALVDPALPDELTRAGISLVRFSDVLAAPATTAASA